LKLNARFSPSVPLPSVHIMVVAAVRGSIVKRPLTTVPPSPVTPHFAPTAKRVIYLHMAGSPPQQDLFEHKPRLNELHGQPCPEAFLEQAGVDSTLKLTAEQKQQLRDLRTAAAADAIRSRELFPGELLESKLSRRDFDAIGR